MPEAKRIAHLKSWVVIGSILVKQLLPWLPFTMASNGKAYLSERDGNRAVQRAVSWRYFVVSTRYGTWNYRRSGHVDTPDRGKPEVNTDEQPLSSTQQADSTSAVGDNFANTDSVDLKRLHDLNFNKNTKRSTNTWVNRFDSWRVSREVPWKLEDIPLLNFDEILQRFCWTENL